MRSAFAYLFLLSVGLVSCSQKPKPIHEVEIGMSQDEIRSLTGNPHNQISLAKAAEGDVELWHYYHEDEIAHEFQFVDERLDDYVVDHKITQESIRDLIRAKNLSQ